MSQNSIITINRPSQHVRSFDSIVYGIWFIKASMFNVEKPCVYIKISEYDGIGVETGNIYSFNLREKIIPVKPTQILVELPSR